jgi:membrane-associated protein
MKYHVSLPLMALLALSAVTIAVNSGLIPSGMTLLESLKNATSDYFYVLVFAIILLESIVFVGFYFPGQFFAVLLVVGANPSAAQILYLTIAMVLAATLGSIVNFAIGRRQSEANDNPKSEQTISLRALLIAMIHINSLAFFMVSQGANGQSWRIVWFAGLINLPYYLLLIFGTAVLSEEIMQLAENTLFLYIAISIWLSIAAVLDYRQYRRTA